MPGLTLSDRVEELRRDVTTLQVAITREEIGNNYSRKMTQENHERLRASIDKLTDKCNTLDNRITSLEERAKSLEKLNDRTWQIAPMVISVAGVLISLLVAYFKK